MGVSKATVAAESAAATAQQRRNRVVIAARGAFTPTAPVHQRDLFAGRLNQLERLMYSIQQPGQHAILYGEPGVGKTSLGKTLMRALDTMECTSIYVSCTTHDDFSSICRSAFEKVNVVESETHSVGFSNQKKARQKSLYQMMGGGTLTPNNVYETLEALCVTHPAVLFVDEFDRIRSRARRPFADLVKSLADSGIQTTLVFIGVAENVEQLIEEHRSTERNLHQIRMPRMSIDELSEVVNRGLAAVSMTIEPLALRRIAVLSSGLPHFTHLVAQQAAVTAAKDGRTDVSMTDVESGVRNAVEYSQHSLPTAYSRASNSTRSESYRNVLLACALAQCDEQGWFTPVDVRNQLDKLGLECGRAATRHLAELCKDSRGSILLETGPSRRHTYRFTNPLMQPYVVMRGVVNGIPVEKVAS